MNHVVVLGGGFAGVSAVHKLLSQNLLDTSITLIDRMDFHLFTPSLYEVATSEEPQKNIAIPFGEIFDKKINFIKDIVESLDVKTQIVKLKNEKEIKYDYLIIALGSEAAYFHIPGLEENAVSLKTLSDAVSIKNKIKTMCCKDGVPTDNNGSCKRKVQVVIGGGGFSGTELAAEMLTYKDRLARQHGLSKQCLEVTIIQGSDRLLNDLDIHVSDIATKRITGPQAKFAFGGHIAEVTKSTVKTDDGKEYYYDILIWTGGVMPNHIAAKSELPVGKHGEIIVNEFLQVQDLPNVFAIGDISGFIDPKTQKPIPTVAEVAEDQGSVAGENIARLMQQKSLKKYKYIHLGYVVPIKGRFAVAELIYGLHFDGLLGWILQQLVFFRYLWGILPPWKAIRRWNKFEFELSK